MNSHSDAHSSSHFRVSVVAMNGAVIAIDDASAADSIISVKRRVFAANRELPVRRQRLVYRPGPRGIDALADDETLGGVGVPQDGSAELDMLLAELSETEAAELATRFLEAAAVGRCAELLELLDDGADIECKDHYGCTALIRAAMNGHADCARVLMIGGADKEAATTNGRTAFLMAVENGRVDCVQLLLDSGAEVNAKDGDGHTALIAAAAMCHEECVRLLLNAGADICAKDKNGHTALDFAKKNGKYCIVSMLEPSGPDMASSSALSLGANALSASKIDVDFLMMNGKRFFLRVERSESILTVKKMIEYKEGISVERQRLIYTGKRCDAVHSLADLNILPREPLHLVLRGA